MIKNLSKIAKIYADLVIKGIKTIDDVPQELKSEVQKILNEMEE